MSNIDINIWDIHKHLMIRGHIKAGHKYLVIKMHPFQLHMKSGVFNSTLKYATCKYGLFLVLDVCFNEIENVKHYPVVLDTFQQFPSMMNHFFMISARIVNIYLI